MRVAILYNSSWYVYLLRRNLIKALVARDIEVTVISPADNYTDRLIEMGARHIHVDMSPRGTHPIAEARTVCQIFQALRRCAPDYVLSFTIKCNLYAGLCNRVLPFYQIANISGLGEGFDRDGLVNRVIRVLYRVSLRSARRIFVQNPDDLETLERQSLIPRDTSELIPGSGVDLTEFTPVNCESRSGPRVFLIFGRFLPKKGYYSFLEAARHLRRRHGSKAEFWILGSPDRSRKESMELYRALTRADCQGVIRLFEPTDDVIPILREADAVVLPSTYNEGVPRSLLEALACGKAVITTDWKGCRETVNDGVNGYLIPPGDQDALEHCLETIIQCDQVQLAEMGSASRRLAEERFDEEHVLGRYLENLGVRPRDARGRGEAVVSNEQIAAIHRRTDGAGTAAGRLQ